jgi:hypothetical protein
VPDADAVEGHTRSLFTPDSYAAAIDRRQRRYLRGLVARSFPDRRPAHHDFGSGRGLRLLDGAVREAHAYDDPALAPRPSGLPVVVTVLGLLLNAEPEVRARAIGFAARALPHAQSGLLVVENHGNRHSLRHRRAATPWLAELSHVEVAELLERYGFSIVEQRGFALMTRAWYGPRLLRPVARLVDRVASHRPALSHACVNILYVARRTRPVPVMPPHPDGTTW